jgi:N-acetylmuramoyl-L-alanine amidase
MTSGLRRVLRMPVLCVLGACLLLTACETPSSSYRGRLEPAGFFDTVVLDAGHGGHDPGAKSPRGSHEKTLALDTSRRVARILRANGLRVIETRTADYFVTLDKRVQVSNRSRGSVFVSLHYNWARRKGAAGVETFYCGSRSSRLAANIQREILQPYRATNRGVKLRGFYVLKNNRRPAVLVELGFISNPAENATIQKPHIRQKLAEAVARGILAERNGRVP